MTNPNSTTEAKKAPKATEQIATEAKETAKKALKTARKKEIKAAKSLLHTFTETAEFKALPENVREAIARVAKAQKAGGGGGKSLIADTLARLFGGKVGTSVSELSIFKETKWGRSEMRKKVRNALQKAVPAERQWIRFDEKAEGWVLDGTGADAPKSWEAGQIPKFK